MPAPDDGGRAATALDLRRLFDDASQFPPAKLDLDGAVAAHRAWRSGPRSPLVGRLLCPAPRAAALAAAVDEPWEIGLVVTPDADAGAATRALGGSPLRVTSIEIPLTAGADAIAAWRAAFPDAGAFVEGRAADVPVIDALGAKAKLRCGGLTAEAIPPVAEVAAFIRACAARGVPFKATAGLHQPLRHRDAALDADQHGFLNLLAATAAALAGADEQELERILLVADLAGLGLDARDTGGARERFESFGTCSIAEPVEALVGLGLLDG